MILENVNICMTIHVALRLDEMATSAEADAPPEHDPDTVLRPHQLQTWWTITLVVLPPDDRTTVTFEYCPRDIVTLNSSEKTTRLQCLPTDQPCTRFVHRILTPLILGDDCGFFFAMQLLRRPACSLNIKSAIITRNNANKLIIP